MDKIKIEWTEDERDLVAELLATSPANEEGWKPDIDDLLGTMGTDRETAEKHWITTYARTRFFEQHCAEAGG